MQSVFDSFCRCFGTPVNPTDMEVITDAITAEQAAAAKKEVVPSTPDMKRRTRSLKLQDEQWDALFDCNATGFVAARRDSCGENVTMEQARAVAKAKIEANGNKKNQKRKRATAEDIFRSKKTPTTREEQQANQIGRAHV